VSPNLAAYQPSLLLGGMPVFLEPSAQIPLVDYDLWIREGAVLDPEGREGLTYLTARCLRRGTGALSAEAVDERIDALGATLSISARHTSVRLRGSVIARNLGPLLELLTELLGDPALRAEDVEHVRRELDAELIRQRDNDRSLAARAFRRLLFGRHPYGRPVMGSRASLAHLGPDAVRVQHRRQYGRSGMVLGLAGDVDPGAVGGLLARTLGRLEDRPLERVEVATPVVDPEPRVLIVDKPRRTQTQVFIGTLGVELGDSDYHALAVANTGFGGIFTSRLMNEVRSKRGWSYGASSHLGADRVREAWSMWTHPSSEQVLDCVELQLDLYRDWLRHGLDDDEVHRARSYLVKSYPFEIDTPAKRLAPRLEAEVHDLDPEWYAEWLNRTRRVTVEDARRVPRQLLSETGLTIVVLASATDRIVTELARRTGASTLDVVRFDAV
jgi:zinc protease